MIDWWWMLAGAAVVLVLGAVAQRRGWIDLRGDGRRGGGAGGLVGSLDEVFAPTRHEAQLERDRQSSLPAPAPVPGDQPGVAAGVPVLESDPDAGEGYRGSIRLATPPE